MRKPWHCLSPSETVQELNSRLEGLTEKEAEERLKRFGPNQLPAENPLSKTRLFFEQVKSPLIYILLLAGAITLILKVYTDAIVIFGVVLLNTIIGFFQEFKASQSLRELKKVLQVKAVVFRDGAEKEILQKEVVPGDIIFLRAGNKAPADLRLIESHNLGISEAVLTGEWVEAEKNTNKVPLDTVLADRDNMAYMGTIIASGWGKGIAVGTGAESEIGKIAELIKETKERKTPYQRKLFHFSRIIGIIIAVVCLAIFIEGLVRGSEFVEIFTTSVAVAAAAIPEGLPVAMTVVLALGMQRILKRKGLVRRLASAETLGSTSIILTDKTGTLTEGKMAVSGIYTNGKEIFNDGDNFNGKIDGNSKESHILALKIALLCNESFIENFEKATEEWIVRGSPTERALLLAGIQAGLSQKQLEKEQPLLDRVLFEPVYQFAVSLRKYDSENNILYIVGAPEKILPLSSFLDDNSQERELLLADFKKIKDKQDELTRQGLRVVAVAYKMIKEKEIDIGQINGLVFVGFFALHDPLRQGIKEVIEVCRQAGMRPIIATGDNKLTAQAVANQLGFEAMEKNILDGKRLSKMTESELDKAIEDIKIFARVEPAHKLRIVRAWQKKGEIVAMTGDGINDAPALKQADIGVALGSGADGAKEVSDLVLLTDNFQIIAAAIEEGRAIVDNIRKVVVFSFSDAFTEIILIGASLFMGWPLPILAAQILWVNLIEDGPLGVSLAFEGKEKGVIKQKPKDYNLHLLNKEMKTLIFIIGLITDFILLGLFGWLFKYSGYSLLHIRSIIFASLTIDSLFYIFSCKSLRRNLWQINSFSNNFLTFSWFFGIIMLAAAFYLPPLQILLKTIPLNFSDWGLIFSLGIINLILIEMTKYWFISNHQT